MNHSWGPWRLEWDLVELSCCMKSDTLWDWNTQAHLRLCGMALAAEFLTLAAEIQIVAMSNLPPTTCLVSEIFMGFRKTIETYMYQRNGEIHRQVRTSSGILMSTKPLVRRCPVRCNCVLIKMSLLLLPLVITLNFRAAV